MYLPVRDVKNRKISSDISILLCKSYTYDTEV